MKKFPNLEFVPTPLWVVVLSLVNCGHFPFVPAVFPHIGGMTLRSPTEALCILLVDGWLGRCG